VRQLENAIFRAVVLAEGEEIAIGEFPQVASAAGDTSRDAAGKPMPTVTDSPALSGAALIMNAPSLPLIDAAGEVRPFDEIEREVIRFAISYYRGQMSEVARRLRIGRSTLYRKLEGLGLEPETADAKEAVSAK
jgi:DNA-binding NtrC family response regulator